MECSRQFQVRVHAQEQIVSASEEWSRHLPVVTVDRNFDAWLLFPAGFAMSNKPVHILSGGWNFADGGEFGICDRRSFKICGPI